MHKSRKILTFSKEHIESDNSCILERNYHVKKSKCQFQYHQVQLPHGVVVGPLNDHQDSKDINMKYLGDVQGLRVLDVGCAIGFMTFEFAKCNVELVRGIEVDIDRLEQAVLIKNIYQFRNVELIHRGIGVGPFNF